MDRFTTIVIISSILDGLILLGACATVFALGRLPRRFTLPRAMAAGLLAGPILLAKALMVLFATEVHVFGLMRLAFIDAVIVVPAVALAVILFGKFIAVRRETAVITTPVRVLAALCVLGGPAVGVYATRIEPTRLQLETAAFDVPTDRALEQSVRIGVLADFQTDHVGPHERRAIDMLLAARPDVIIIPGDVFQGTAAQLETHLPELRSLFARLDAPGGVYFTYGNCDPPAFIDAMFRDLDIVILHNAITTATVRGQRITIGGLEEHCRSPQARAVLRQLETQPGDELRVLVSHYPDALLEMSADSRIDLLVAGHTHGGQVCVPMFGPPLTLTDVPRAIAAGGLHVLDGRRIYVSRGVGHERGQAPRIRFLCPPEVSVVTVSAARGRHRGAFAD